MRRSRIAATSLLAALLLAAPAIDAQTTPRAQKPQKRKPAAAAGAHAPAEVAPVPLPPVPAEFAPVEGQRVTLADAIRTTLERDPEIEIARRELQRVRGIGREAAGRFDPVFSIAPSVERQKTFLTESALRGEVSKREFLRDSSENLTRIASEIASGLTDDKGVPFPDCRGSQYFINGQPICTQNLSPTDYQTFQLLQDAQDQTAGSGTVDKLQQAITKSVNRRLANVVALIRRVFLPALGAQLVAIGDLPRESETDTVILDIRLQKPFRNGMTVGPAINLEADRFAFSDKPDSPAYGGTGVATQYRAVLGLVADVPLLRGGGSGSADAEERSARLQAEAALESLAQTASNSVLKTTIAYWSLAGAQEIQKIFGKGVAGQRRISELSRALVTGDEIPRSELMRVDAQSADVEASALQARREVDRSRVELARAMGLDVSRIEDAPLAADPLPSLADVPVPDAHAADLMAQRLRDLRGDLRAARDRVEAARVLERAARLDLRPRLDLSIMAGMSAFYEDPRFSTTKAWDSTGYYRAFGRDFTGPSVQVSLALELPFGNHTQRGRLVDAESFRTEAEISARELERQAANEVHILAAALPSAASEARARETASAEAEKTVTSDTERFRAGETSVMGTILTERSRLQRQADLVAARQTLALRAARLRWAGGTLLPVTRTDGELRFGETGSR